MENDESLLDSWILKVNFEEEIVAEFLMGAFVEDNRDYPLEIKVLGEKMSAANSRRQTIAAAEGFTLSDASVWEGDA